VRITAGGSLIASSSSGLLSSAHQLKE